MKIRTEHLPSQNHLMYITSEFPIMPREKHGDLYETPPSVCSILCLPALALFLLCVLWRYTTTFSGN